MKTGPVEALRKLRARLAQERRDAAFAAAEIDAGAPDEGPDDDAQHRINSYLMIALDRHTMVGVLDAVIREDHEDDHPDPAAAAGQSTISDRHPGSPKGVV